MAAKQDKPNDIAALNFEHAFSRLAAAVERLQGGNLSLEQAIAEFESGQALAERCGKLLDEAELKVSQVAVNVNSTMVSESAATYTLDLFSLRTSSDDGDDEDDDNEATDKDDRFKDIPF